jgi:hypothetical protein
LEGVRAGQRIPGRPGLYEACLSPCLPDRQGWLDWTGFHSSVVGARAPHVLEQSNKDYFNFAESKREAEETINQSSMTSPRKGAGQPKRTPCTRGDTTPRVKRM